MKNAAAVCAVSLLLNTAGVLFRTYAANRVGAEAMGLLQLILSVYYPACTLASSGIYVASTRLNAEAIARKDRSPEQIVNRCLLYSALFGGAAFVLLFSGAGFIARCWLKTPSAALPLRILSFGLPFLSASGGLQGFFLALRKPSASTFLQVTEDGFKISSTLLLFGAFLHRGPDAALCAVTAGMAIGEILSCLCGYFFYLHSASRLPSIPSGDPKPIFGQILHIALPCAFSAYLRSGLGMINGVLIPRGLEASGLTEEQTLAAMGKLEGMALPLLTYPAVFLTVVSKLLVPELTARHATGNDGENRAIVAAVLRRTLEYALFLAEFAFAFGPQLGLAVYRDPVCGDYVRRLAPLVPLLYCDSVTDGMIKGYNRQLSSMKINLVDAVLRTGAAWLLLPKTGIVGYTVLLIGGSAFNCCLSLRTLLHASGAKFPWVRGVILPLVRGGTVLLPLRLLMGNASPWLALAAGGSAYLALTCLSARIKVWYAPPKKRAT